MLLGVRLLAERRRKIIEHMRQNPNGWRFDQVRNLLEFYGFTMRQRPGSHRVFSHPDLNSNLSIPDKNPVKGVYVKKVIGFLDDLLEKRRTEDEI